MTCGESKAPPGWYCTREVGHDGPCAAWPIEGHDNFTFHRPLAVRCNCVHVESERILPCEGKLRSDGRNRSDNLTFLLCDVCCCCYVAEDAKKREHDKEAKDPVDEG